MGQSVTVVRKPSSNPEVVRFEINRSLTGMGHERYRSPADIVRDRPVDVLARRLFEHGGIDGIHVNSSVITVDLAGGSTGVGIEDVIRHLFRFYGDEQPGDEAAGPPTDAVPEPDAAEAPENAVVGEAAAAGTAADRSDAPSSVDDTKPTPDPTTPTGIERPEETNERDAELAGDVATDRRPDDAASDTA